MRVYISGPITGIDDYVAIFQSYVSLLCSKGYDVVNPASVEGPDWTWEQFMQYDLALLRECDGIYMLPGWTNSRGARIEKRYAKRKGIPVLNEGR